MWGWRGTSFARNLGCSAMPVFFSSGGVWISPRWSITLSSKCMLMVTETRLFSLFPLHHTVAFSYSSDSVSNLKYLLKTPLYFIIVVRSSKRVFGSVVAVTFQIAFRVEKHINNVFSFFKNHFWYQLIKTIQKVQIALNFNKKKKIWNFTKSYLDRSAKQPLRKEGFGRRRREIRREWIDQKTFKVSEKISRKTYKLV